MKPGYKTLLTGLFAIALLDSLGSVASRYFDFNYSILSPLSFMIYSIIAFLTAKKEGIKKAIIFTALLGLFDSIVGWKISMLLVANTGNVDNNPTVVTWIITVIILTLVTAVLGFIVGGIAIKMKTKHKA